MMTTTAATGAPPRAACATKSGVFALTFFSYVLFHASRKSFSAIKGEMSNELWMHSSVFPEEQQAQMYGLLDTLFMGSYAIGLYASGILGDHYDLRKMIAGGMGATGVVMLAFGLGALFDIHALSFYAVLWALNGLIQSSGWPANVAVMGKWFDQSERGAVLGIWSGNGSFGNIVGAALVAIMFEIFHRTLAWKMALIVVGVLIALYGLLIHFLLVPDPRDAPYQHESLEDAKPETPAVKGDAATKQKALEADKTMSELSEGGSPKGISFLAAWCIPGVLPYALSYACLKSVNYALFFWLPFYLTVALNMSNPEAGTFSMLYDVGQILGGFTGGYISDKMGVRSPVIVAMLLLSCITIYNFHGASYNVTAVLLLTSGFMLGGPANLISTAISADLGTHSSIKGDAAALSTVTGIIDGTGSIGAAVVQYLVGYLSQCHNEPPGCDPKDPTCIQVCSWGPVFILLQVGTLLACVCLLRLLYHDIMTIRKRGGAADREQVL